MLSEIESYLVDILTQERTDIFIEALTLIHSYEILSPLETINEIIQLQDTYTPDEAIGIIQSIIANGLQEILSQQYIISTGDLLQKLELLKGMNLIEHYIDSEVILSLHEDALSPQEMLMVWLSSVTQYPVEYFDAFIVDVRPTLINNVMNYHQEQVDAVVTNNEDGVEPSKLEVVKAFALKHPEALGVVKVKSGTIQLDMDIEVLLKLMTHEIYKLTKPIEIAEAIYSLVLVSATEQIEVPKMTMNVVNLLYNEIDIIGELKYLVTSFD